MWRVFKESRGPDGKVRLDVCGVRRLVPIGDGTFQVLHRDLWSGQWVSCGVKPCQLPDLTLRGGAKNPAVLGRVALSRLAGWLANAAMDEFEKRLPDLPPPPRLMEGVEDTSPSGLERRRRLHNRFDMEKKLKGHILSLNPNEAVRINWLSYAKAVWSNLDRNDVSILVATRFRKSYSFGQYLQDSHRLPVLRRMARVSRTLLPWFEEHASAMEAEEMVDRMEAGEAVELRAKDAQLHFWGRDPGPVRSFDWKVLAGQPFSVGFAISQITPRNQSDFLDAWMAQDPALRKRSAWVAQLLPHAFLDSEHGPSPWRLENYPVQVWVPLLQLVLEQADRRRQEEGFANIQGKAWRMAFFRELADAVEQWRNGANVPQRRLSAQEMVNLIAPGPLSSSLQAALINNHGGSISTAPAARRIRL